MLSVRTNNFTAFGCRTQVKFIKADPGGTRQITWGAVVGGCLFHRERTMLAMQEDMTFAETDRDLRRESPTRCIGRGFPWLHEGFFCQKRRERLAIISTSYYDD